MNCDHAFELMTAPSGDPPAEWHRHLEGCPRCRQMYETLSPALGLFASSEPASGEYSDSTSMASGVEIAERVAVRLQQRSAPAQPAKAAHTRRLVWATLLAGGLGFLSAIGWTALQPSAPGTPAHERCTWTHRAAIPAGQPAAEVVLSCVTCHAATPQQPHTAQVQWEDWKPQTSFEHQAFDGREDLLLLQWALWPGEPLVHT